MANQNATIVLDVSMINLLGSDKDLGAKLAAATSNAIFGGDNTISYGEGPERRAAITVIESHLSDETRVVAVGSNMGRDLGSAGKASNLTKGNERHLLEQVASNFGLVIRNEAKERSEEEKKATREKAAATRAANQQLKAGQGSQGGGTPAAS